MISYKKRRQDAQTKLKQLKKSHNNSTFDKWQCFYYFHTTTIKIYHVNKLNIIFLPIYEVKDFFNTASLIENCLTCPHIPHTYATTTIYHEKVYRAVFNFQEKVV